MLNKPSLYVASVVEIQMEVSHGGLDVDMSQAIFNFSDVFASIE